MCPREAVTPWRAHTGAGSWKEMWPVKRGPHWSRFACRTCDPVGDPKWRSLFLKDCTPWKGSTLERIVKDSMRRKEQQ